MRQPARRPPFRSRISPPAPPASRALKTTLVALSIPAVSLAAAASPERPPLPAAGIAAEDGAGAIWRNPASFALDPDESWLLMVNQDLDGPSPSLIAAANQVGPIGLGISHRSLTGPSGPSSWTTMSTGLGLRLDHHLAMGAHLGWQLPDGPDNNFVTWDLGVTWRPTSWIGLGAVAQNIGSPDPADGVEQRGGPGLTLRPVQDRVLLSADYMFGEGPGSDVLEASLRVFPVEGLALRGYADSRGTAGAGVELFFGKAGAGVQARLPNALSTGAGATSSDAAQTMLYAMSARPERRALGGGDRVVSFDLDGTYPYQPSRGLFSQPSEAYLHLLGRLEDAADDHSIHTLILKINATPFSLAQVQELRSAMQRARDNGQTVIAYLGQSTSNAAYYLACQADQVYLHPAASLDIIGLSAELQFYKGALDRVGVQAQYARRAEYKSGPEPLTRTEASNPAREQIDALLDDISGQWVADIAQGRHLSKADILAAIDKAPLTPQAALQMGLVDDLIYPDQVDEQLAQPRSRFATIEDDYRQPDATVGWPSQNLIAVITIEDSIISGASRQPGLLNGRATGSRTVVQQLDQARRDDAVKAVVMRVDSPGGSAFASDEIWRAVERVKDANKPVIVSMGGVAASGGYYVASGADAIFAEPTTITGSIGVYGGKLNTSGLYDKLGIRTEIHDRGRNASMWSMSQPLDDMELATLDHLIGDTYAQFKSRVAQGRALSDDQVEEVARGRVWSGKAAVDIGLVDELGGFPEAVARARQEAGLGDRADVSLIAYADQPGPGGELSQHTIQSLRVWLFPELSQAPAPLPAELRILRHLPPSSDERVWMLMPYSVDLR